MTCTNIIPITNQYQVFQELKRGGFSSMKKNYLVFDFVFTFPVGNSGFCFFNETKFANNL